MFMKKILLMAFVALACHTDRNEPPPVQPEEPEELAQYGTPFAAVPHPENIVLYEVNIRAFSLSKFPLKISTTSFSIRSSCRDR